MDDEELFDLEDEQEPEPDPAPEPFMADMTVEREKPVTDWSKVSKEDFESALAAVRGGEDERGQVDQPIGPEGVAAVQRLNEAISSPDTTPEDIRRLGEELSAAPEPEVVGYLRPEDLALLGIHATEPVPISREAKAKAQPWADLIAETARENAAARERQWAREAGEPPKESKPVDYDSLSAEAILALGEAARTGVRPTFSGQSLTPDIVARAFGESD